MPAVKARPAVGTAPEVERRCVASDPGRGAEARVQATPRGIRGMAALFDTPSNIGGQFEEIIRPGFFDGVLSDNVRGLFNHNPNKVLGRVPRTMQLRATRAGLEYIVPDMPKARADVLEAVQRGDVTGSSFSFRVAAGGERWTSAAERRDGSALPLRELLTCGALIDVGPVTFPAYEGTTVSARAARVAAAGGVDASSLERARLAVAEVETGWQLDRVTAAVEQERAEVRRLARPGRLRSMAYHEAGHAVAAWATGTSVAGLRVDGVVRPIHRAAGGSYLALAQYEPGGPPLTPEIALAGPAAERILARRNGQPLPDRWSYWWSGDAQTAEHRGATTPAAMGAALERAERVLADHWPAVEALADALGRRIVLDGTEVLQILYDHTTAAQRSAAWSANYFART